MGDNLYSDSILALDARSGRLKWYFQYTPHDLWDWDAQQPPVLVDADWQGKPRRLLLHANRNGFFYVLDRTTGALLLAKPFVKKLTWAREIQPGHGPVLRADAREVHRLHEGARRVAVRQVLLRREHEGGAGRTGPEDPPCHRREDRRHRLGAAANRSHPLLGRHPGHRQRPGLFRRRQRRPHGGGRLEHNPLWHFQTNTLSKASP